MPLSVCSGPFQVNKLVPHCLLKDDEAGRLVRDASCNYPLLLHPLNGAMRLRVAQELPTGKSASLHTINTNSYKRLRLQTGRTEQTARVGGSYDSVRSLGTRRLT
jgi:hypothetical protein